MKVRLRHNVLKNVDILSYEILVKKRDFGSFINTFFSQRLRDACNRSRKLLINELI